MIVLDRLLGVNDLERLRALIERASFVEGRATSILATKNNLQIPFDSAQAREAGELVLERLRAHDLFKLGAQPMALSQPLFSAYYVGMEYPDHVDAALMGTLRTDLSVTVFLSPADSYDGGELVVDTGVGSRRFRLDAGDAVVYPTSNVHRVARVTRGVRLAAVLWVQSAVRDPLRREILLDLGLAMQELAETSCSARLSRAYWNLLRLWAETSPGHDAREPV